MENITNRRTMEFKFGTSKTLFKKIQQKKESHKTKPEVIPTTILPNKNSVLVNFLTSKSPRKFHKEIRLRFILSVAYCYRFIQRNYKSKMSLYEYKEKIRRREYQKQYRYEVKYLKNMVELYGYKQAYFLRGNIKDFHQTKFKLEEQLNSIVKRIQLDRIRNSEFQLFVNSFKFSQVCLNSEDRIPSLLTLDETTPDFGCVNLANIHYETYLINIEELRDFYVSRFNRLLENLKRFIKQVEEFKKEKLEVFEDYLKKYLKTYKSNPKPLEITRVSNQTYFNDKVDRFISTIKGSLWSKPDFMLLDLKFAWYFCKVLMAQKNMIKAYKIIRSAFIDNLEALDNQIELYLVVKRLKPLLKKFDLEFKNEEKNGKKNKFEKSKKLLSRRTFYEWNCLMRDKETRGPYLSYYLTHLNEISSLNDLRNMVSTLAQLSTNFDKSHISIQNYERLIYLHIVMEKFKLIRKLEDPKILPHKKILSYLELNKKIILIKNTILDIAVNSDDYSLSLQYYTMIVFIYKNSIAMIDETDPNKYTKKNKNIYNNGDGLFEAALKNKDVFLGYLNFFNDQLKISKETYSKLWTKLEKASVKKISNFLFGLIKNVEGDLDKLRVYNRASYEQYIMQFNNKYFMHKLCAGCHIDSYQRDFIGEYNFEEIEIFLNLRLLRLERPPKLQKVEQIDTQKQPKKSKRVEGLIKSLINRKINNLVVSKYYHYKSNKLDLWAQILNFVLYSATKEFVDTRMMLEARPINLKNPMILRQISQLETFHEYIVRVSLNMTDTQKESFRSIINEAKNRILSLRKLNIKKKNYTLEEDLGTRKTFSSIKNEQYIKKSSLGNPDHNIGFLLRRKGSNIKGIKKTSSFYYQAKNRVSKIAQKYEIQQYGESQILRRPNPKRSKSQHFREPALDLLDIFNIHQNTKAFFQSRSHYKKQQQELAKQRILRQATSKQNMFTRNFQRSASFYSMSQRDVELVHLDQTMTIVNGIKFHFQAIKNSKITEYVVTFNLQQDVISFEFTYNYLEFKKCSVKFFLNLENHLWELKEQFMLSQRKSTSISTYFPVLHELYAEWFFRPVLNNFYEEEKSIEKNDILELREFTKPMALKYSILITQLQGYDNTVLQQMKMQNIGKYDLDSIQCLLQIMNFLGNILENFRFSSKIGNCMFDSFDLKFVKENEISLFRRINRVHILKKKFEEFVKKNQKKIFKKLLFQDFLIDKRKSILLGPTIEDVLLNVDMLTSILGFTIFLKKNHKNSKIKKIGKNTLKYHVARSLVKDPNQEFIFIDLSSKVDVGTLKSNRKKLKISLEKISKICSISETYLSAEQFNLLALFYFYNSIISFQFSFDSYFQQLWEKVFSKNLENPNFGNNVKVGESLI